jgi:hypothetical protein
MDTEETSLNDESSAAPRTGTRWGQDRRLEFIEYRLRWSGHLNRSDLTTFFSISIPQASLDLTEYARRAPTNLEYDRSTRMYVAGKPFHPVFAATDADRYLGDLLQSANGFELAADSFLGTHPPVAIAPRPGRHLSPSLVEAIVRAIRAGNALRLQYQSLTRPAASTRTLTPHALAHDGWRWHIRAYCHTRQEFRDFLVSRILEVEGTEPDRHRGADDAEWNKYVRVVLAPHSDLALAHQKAIELDYGMTNGVCEFQCRQALLFYVLRQLGLDRDSNRPPEDQQIVLSNSAELESFLPKTKIR